jgi:hypothetical protein
MPESYMIVILLKCSGSTANGTKDTMQLNYCYNFLRICINELVVQSYIYSFPLSQFVTQSAIQTTNRNSLNQSVN